MILLGIALAAAVGAPARYAADVWLAERTGGLFPWGTLFVNVSGSFVFGLLVGSSTGNLRTIAGTGFCGAFTTFSTMSYETVRLAEGGSYLEAASNIALNLVIGLVAALIGLLIGESG